MSSEIPSNVNVEAASTPSITAENDGTPHEGNENYELPKESDKVTEEPVTVFSEVPPKSETVTPGVETISENNDTDANASAVTFSFSSVVPPSTGCVTGVSTVESVFSIEGQSSERSIIGMDMENSLKQPKFELQQHGGTVPQTMSTTPSIVKPRRPSVHFAETDYNKISRPASVKLEGGSRKHRSRKEKLVCRSESLTDMGMDMDATEESPSISMPSSPLPTLGMVGAPSSTITVAAPPPIVLPSLQLVADVTSNPSPVQTETDPPRMKPPPALPSRSTSSTVRTPKMKSRVKRINNSSNASRGMVSRKSISPVKGHGGPFIMGGLKEPPVKKKKVIEIVSPRKRKAEPVKTSDPIIVRAANKPSKTKKSHHNPYKFSRANLYKTPTSFQGGQQRFRRSSGVSLPQSSPTKGGGFMNKRYGSPQKREAEADSPAFPLTCVEDLMWLLREAEKEFSPDRPSRLDSTASASTSQSLPSKTGLQSSDVLPGTPNIANRKLHIGRRRVESEPPTVAGFEVVPGSPSAPLYQFRKDIYFSPSPSYTAGPSGRHRYSRRRHARIHPPIDQSNCYFQGHHCPNPKVAGSQYCEKHLDQGPTSAYSHCRYIKNGRQCANLIPTTGDLGVGLTFCETHANLIARNEHDQRNPKAQPDQAKNIISKINRIFNEGFSKPEVDCFGIATNPDVLQILEEPEVVQELPFGSFSGGLLEELDSEGERNVNPDKPDYDALKNAGYYTTEEIIQIHIHKLKKLKTLYQREKELELLTRQQKLRFYREGLEKLKQYGMRFTTNPYLINKNIEMPKEYIEHQIREYDAAKAILQTAYKADGQRGLLRLKMLQKTQELARMAKASGQKQHDSLDIDSDTDVDSDSGESRERRGSSRLSTMKTLKCAYNEGYAVRACQNPPVYWSNYCFKHILSDSKQVQWVPCNRRIGPDPQDLCKTPCLKILEKHGCIVHSPLVMSKHKPLRRSEEELHLLADSENEEEDVPLEGESLVLANLVSDECIRASHLDEAISRLTMRGPLDHTDTSDSEETDEEGLPHGPSVMNDEEEEEEDSELNTALS